MFTVLKSTTNLLYLSTLLASIIPIEVIDVLRQIATQLADTHVKGVNLAAVIYMYDIRVPRFTGSAAKNIRMFEKLIGEAALSNVVLITNR